MCSQRGFPHSSPVQPVCHWAAHSSLTHPALRSLGTAPLALPLQLLFSFLPCFWLSPFWPLSVFSLLVSPPFPRFFLRLFFFFSPPFLSCPRNSPHFHPFTCALVFFRSSSRLPDSLSLCFFFFLSHVVVRGKTELQTLLTLPKKKKSVLK